MQLSSKNKQGAGGGRATGDRCATLAAVRSPATAFPRNAVPAPDGEETLLSRDARWDALLELVGKHGRVDVEEAAAALDVSAATIRRDLDQLAEQHLLTRTRGGAVAHGVSYELALRYKTGRHAPEKQAIGRAVSGLVAVGEVVGLTGGRR
ncbi:hypothetical protein SCALM49S_06781 [Streptomyces californicus]